ncbi:MAG: hypothetical protein KIT83_04205 [Bryobacterales bacterium]|nr:hypothetical protein [Bryobacterales bacterium]
MEVVNQVAFDAAVSAKCWNLGYDAEGRVHTAENTASGVTTTYEYDGEGHRVAKTVGSTVTWFVYDAFGQLAAEYSSAGATGTGGTHYMTTDHLGSTRLVTDGGGAVVSRHDYFPFGEEIGPDVSGRTTIMKYVVTDDPTQRFTGKERDAETGLDYFGARYMSAAQGRFTSPDPLLSSAHITAPQSWNRYAYTLNNPLRYTDPHGLYICSGTTSECKDFESAVKQVERARNSYKKGSAEYNALNGSLQAYGKRGVDNGVTVQFGATKSGGAGELSIGVAADGAGRKVVTADNPTGQNMTVTFDLSQHTNISGALDLGSLAVSAAHEGIHTGHGTAYVGALPMDLTSAAAAGVLAGPLNLTKYATEFAAYSGSSFTAQGLGFGSLKVGGNFEIWNSGWKAADVNTLRSNGINAVLSDPNGLYKVTPGAPGKKIGE